MADIRLKGVTKRFGETVAVDAIDLVLQAGSFTTFLGPSGCGKTTTLRMIAGLEQPSEGEIWLGPDLVSSPSVFVLPEKRQIGMVFQSYAVWPHMTVFDNVAFPLKIRRGVSRSETREQTRRALETVQLGALAERYPAELSGGQQQRVALARAIVLEPKLLLLDEPLSNLDSKLREQMRIELRELQQRLKVTTLYVTHDQVEAMALSDVVMVMNEGRIVQTGTPREIHEQPQTRFVADFVGWTNFLPASVIDRDTVTVLGQVLRSKVPENLAEGTHVQISIRPKHVTVLPNGAAGEQNVMSAELKTTLYMGDHELCELAIGDHTVLAHAPADLDLGTHRSVEVVLDPNQIRVLAT